MTLKEKLKNSKYIRYDDNIHYFDFIYVIVQRKKHSSGYNLLNIYGSIINENHEEIFYTLSQTSDVIDFDDIRSKFDWICSLDIPEYNVLRFFARQNEKFYIENFSLSSFKISIRGESNAR